MMGGATLQLIKKDTFIRIIVVVLIVAFAGVPSLLYPFGRDQGVFAYAASACLEGKILYKDVFDVKPPLTFFWTAAALVLFGHSMISIRIFDVIWQCATAVAILLLADAYFRNRYIGVLAALLYGLRYFFYSYWHTAQTDGFITLPLVACLLMVLMAKDRNRTWLWFFSGIFLGAAVLFKYPIGVLLVFIILIILLQSENSLKTNLSQLIFTLAGFCVPIALFLSYLMANGAFTDYIYMQFTFISQYSSGHGSGGSYLISLLKNMAAYWRESVIFLLAGLLALCEIIYAIKNKRSIDGFILVFWWFAAVVHLTVQNKYYIYHTLPIIAPLALMVSHWVFILYDWISKFRLFSKVSPVYIISFIVLILFIFQNYPRKYMDVFEVVSGRRNLKSFYGDRMFGAYDRGDYSMKANLEVSDYIKDNSDPEDGIFVWGFEPSVYFLSERGCASRFIFNYPLYGEFEWQQLKVEFLEEMSNKMPQYVLIVKNDIKRGVTGKTEDSFAAFLAFDEFHHFVQKEYEYDTTIEDFVIFKRKA